jgi:eukaryotic-like serine/threonine-protein kinase
MNEESLYVAARGKPPQDRAAYLKDACGDNAELRAGVEELLRADEQADSLLDKPANASEFVTLDMPAPIEKPGTQIGPYKLLQQIGEGGFGVVYMAEQTKPVRRKVALKIIKPGMDTREVIARFEAERQALALMEHPNIAKVLDAGTTGKVEGQGSRDAGQKEALDAGPSALDQAGRPYFVMELVRGIPITEFCDEQKLSTRERLKLFVDVCRAIQHAHQKGVIHRDLKPSNVMVTLDDERPIPKVIDFGISKALSQQLTEKTLFTAYGQMIGTPLYMAPEQAQLTMRDVDTRSDVYSLGVLLYELLTGTTPFDRETLQKSGFDEMRRIIREVDPPRPSARISTMNAHLLSTISARHHIDPRKLSASLRGELDWIVMKALEKDRNRRYETASGFAADVERYLADEPVQACPPSAAYRLRKFARRNRVALTFAALVLFFIGSLGGVAGWAVRDRVAREEEIADERATQLSAVEREVDLALLDAERWQAVARWPEALSSVKRAEGLLAGGSGDRLRERVLRSRNDLEMVLRLEEIALRWSELKQDAFDYGGADRDYAAAFTAYGIDVANLPADEAAARIRARSGVAIALLAALDDWAFVRLSKDKAHNLPLLAVIQAADGDHWRRDVREALKRKDGKALTALSASPRLLHQPPTSLLLLARALRDYGPKDAEIAVLRQAQREHPGDFWINLQLAWALTETKPPRVDEAVSFYRAALAVRPRNAATLCNLGNALRRRRMLVDAVACLRRATELSPNFVSAHYNLGLTVCAQGKLEAGIASYRKAIELDPNFARAHWGLGNARMRQGKLVEAIACFRKAIEISPKGSMFHTHLGLAFGKQRKWNQAIACMHKAIECQPDNVVAHCNLALNLVRQGKPAEAEVWSRKALALNRKFADAHNVLGMALHDQKKLDAAIASFRKAIELRPKFADAHSNLGNVLQDQRKFQEAIASYHKAIAIDPGHVNAHVNLGNAFYRQNKYDDAVVWYRKALALDPKHANAHCNLGMALSAQKKLDEAIACFRKRVELNPQTTFSWQYLGWLEYRTGNWKASIVALERSCKLQPGGTGDCGQWIVLALAHARLASRTSLSAKERANHQAIARRWYEQANEQIDRWWRVRPGHLMGQQIWDFRAEATTVLGIENRQPAARAHKPGRRPPVVAPRPKPD